MASRKAEQESRRLAGLEQAGLVEDLEVRRLRRLQVVGLPQDADRLGLGGVGLCPGGRLDGDDRVGVDVADQRVLDRGERGDDHVVLVLDAVGSLLLQHSDDPEADSVEGHLLAEGVEALAHKCWTTVGPMTATLACSRSSCSSKNRPVAMVALRIWAKIGSAPMKVWRA